MILEDYVTRPYGHVTARWTVGAPGDLIVVGGMILDADDWRHLRDDLGCRSVVNCQVEENDEGKGIERLTQVGVPDDGNPFPLELVRHAVSFAQLAYGHGRIYVHCALGNSRSPAFAYAILRFVFGYSAERALAAIREGKPGVAQYATLDAQRNYLDSVERALQLA